MHVSQNIHKIKQDLESLSQKETLEADGRTSTSSLRFEIKQIQVFENLEETSPDIVYNNTFLSIESQITKKEIMKIPITMNTLNINPSFEFIQKNFASIKIKSFCISFRC